MRSAEGDETFDLCWVGGRVSAGGNSGGRMRDENDCRTGAQCLHAREHEADLRN